jgi:hypothetical protein
VKAAAAAAATERAAYRTVVQVLNRQHPSVAYSLKQAHAAQSQQMQQRMMHSF